MEPTPSIASLPHPSPALISAYTKKLASRIKEELDFSGDSATQHHPPLLTDSEKAVQHAGFSLPHP
jgi:hypothetical protein